MLLEIRKLLDVPNLRSKKLHLCIYVNKREHFLAEVFKLDILGIFIKLLV